MRHFLTLSATALTLALAACADAPVLPESPVSAVASMAGVNPGTSPTGGSGLRVTYLNCFDSGGGGYAYTTTACTGLVEGGTGGNTYSWDVIQTWRADSEHGSQIHGVCNRGTSLTITFTATDSSGSTASASSTVHCSWSEN